MRPSVVLLALTAFPLLACAGAPVGDAVETVDAPPEPARCETYRMPAELRFACNEMRFDPELGSNRETLADLVEGLRARRGVRGVSLRGTISASAASERERPELAAQRAFSVAEALVAEGYPRDLIEVLDVPGPETAAYKKNEPDPCPPAHEDEHGDRRRAVFINVVVCEP